MNYKQLGRTDLKVSTAGLGCGGSSKLGLGKCLGEDNAIKIVKAALELGVTFFDTSAVYGTETVLGKGLAGTARDKVVISTKFPPADSSGLKPEGSLTKTLENSLKCMNIDYIDILNLHGVMPEYYKESRDRFMPELIKAKEAGKIGWIGITEMFSLDTKHEMEQMAVADDLWDTIMIGFNIMNSSAIKKLLPTTQKNNVGTIVMFAVRTALSNNQRLIEIMNELTESGEVDPKLFNTADPLDFLRQDGVAKSIMDAAYRFCSHTDGLDVILTGTSNSEHLKDNIKSILSPPLPSKIVERIMNIFGNIDSVSAQ